MVKFRVSSPLSPKPDSPVLMFRDLRRDTSIKYLWGHQEKLLDQFTELLSKKDVPKDLAIELPTGSGKTLVGLLMAEYRRRAFGERAVFLCPTRQLCHQVFIQAQKYGIATSLLVGPQQDYNSDAFFKYQQAKAVAITTYSGLFNTHPRINDAELIVCDDAHAADNYVSSMWTLNIKKSSHPAIFQALFQELEAVIPANMAHLMKYHSDDPVNKNHVDLISTVSVFEHFSAIRDIFREFTVNGLQYSWDTISPHLEACSIYCSVGAFEIRMTIPPTMTHAPFSQAHQRIYMSATLGEDGDIERSFGVKNIVRLPIPEGWDKRGTGRRLILFPGISIQEDIEFQILVDILECNENKRALISVPDNRVKDLVKEQLLTNSCEILEPKDVEYDIDLFTKNAGPVVLLATNRYDGIDLPGDDCRIMLLLETPLGVGLQEKFLLYRLGAISQLRDRIRTRITQALGRCTRDESDYSVVLVAGPELLKWFSTSGNIQGMHPELQAEISFGLENSTDRSMSELIELANIFLMHSAEWEEAEQSIQQNRQKLSKIKDTVADALHQAALLEINYSYASWNGQFEEALKLAKKITDVLENDSSLKPYRVFWHHQAAVSAFLAWKASGNEALKQSAIFNLNKASKASVGIPWLARLRMRLMNDFNTTVTECIPLQEWFGEINNLLSAWRLQGGKYAKSMAQAEKLITDKEAKPFEQGLEILGRMLGARIYRWTTDEGSPDGLWVFGDWHAFVFEAKTNEKPEGSVSLNDARQTATHEQYVRAHKLIPDFMPCSTILITPKQNIHRTATIATENMTYVTQDEIIQLFHNASSALDQIRTLASGNTEESLLLAAEKIYSSEHITMMDVRDKLLKKKLSDMPIIEEKHS